MIPVESLVLQHSQRLKQHICHKIDANGGKISFAEYMHQALYAPGLGYYNAGCTKFGAGGDFVTAPEIGNLFAQCLAAQIQQILEVTRAATVLEIGAGSGQLACDIIHALHANNCMLQNYYILELSADLRNRQQEKTEQTCAQYAHIVKWLDQLPDSMHGVVIANEVMDAMPVAKFHYANNQLQEYYVIANADEFAYTLDKPTDELSNAFNNNKIATYISQPYISEINLFLPAWIKSLGDCLTHGAILLFDYGFPRHEYYHPQRNHGTLMCHYKHQCHADPLINLGLQDITAHVDFTAIAQTAYAHNLSVAGYTNLASFLLNCGLTDLCTLSLASISKNTTRKTHEINTLTSPAEMGELFKVIALTRDVEFELAGFGRFNKACSL